MTTEIRKIEREAHVLTCEICKEEIIGWSKSHAYYNLGIHKSSKHGLGFTTGKMRTIEEQETHEAQQREIDKLSKEELTR